MKTPKRRLNTSILEKILNSWIKIMDSWIWETDSTNVVF